MYVRAGHRKEDEWCVDVWVGPSVCMVDERA